MRKCYTTIGMIRSVTKQLKTETLASLRKLHRFLSLPRHFLRGSYLEYGIIILVFISLAVIYTDFIAFNINSQLFIDGPGDGTSGFLWLNFAYPDPNPLLGFTDFANYPYGEKMGGATFITYMALWLPLRVLSTIFGPVAGINLVTLWGFVAAGLGGYWLLKKLTSSVTVALFAGFAIAFVPYSLGKSTVHLAYIFSIVFVLIVAAFIALWSKPTKQRAVIFAASIALAFYTDGYYILLASSLVVGLVMAGVLHSLLLRYEWRQYLPKIKMLFLSLLALVVFMIPVAYVQLTQSSQINKTLDDSRGEIADEIKTYRANVIDFLIPSQGNPILTALDSSQTILGYKYQHSNASESNNYVGMIVVALCVIGFTLIGIWAAVKKRSSLDELDSGILSSYILVGSITFVTVPLFLAFMFSPEVYVFGYTIPLPGRFLIDHDIALWRVMSRFFVPLHVVMVIFASFTLWIILKSSRFIQRRTKYKNVIVTAVVVSLTLLTALEYWTTVNRPSFDFRNEPAAYQWLSKQNDINVVAELPMVDPSKLEIAYYTTAQILHKKKLVNIKEATNREITNTLGSVDNPETIDFVYNRGAQAVILHDQECSSVSWGAILFKDDKNKICIYKINKPITSDRLYIKFENGFSYTISRPKLDSSTTTIMKSDLVFSVVDQNFQMTNTGSVQFKSEIEPFFNGSINGKWVLKQNNKDVGSGSINESRAKIDVTIDAAEEVQLFIYSDKMPLKAEDIQLNNTIVTRLF